MWNGTKLIRKQFLRRVTFPLILQLLFQVKGQT